MKRLMEWSGLMGLSQMGTKKRDTLRVFTAEMDQEDGVLYVRDPVSSVIPQFSRACSPPWVGDTIIMPGVYNV